MLLLYPASTNMLCSAVVELLLVRFGEARTRRLVKLRLVYAATFHPFSPNLGYGGSIVTCSLGNKALFVVLSTATIRLHSLVQQRLRCVAFFKGLKELHQPTARLFVDPFGIEVRLIFYSDDFKIGPSILQSDNQIPVAW